MKDYYKILEIHPEASQEVMNKAYRALVKKFHPDQYHLSNKTPMKKKMQDINEAYETLSDPQRRKRYDANYQGGLFSDGRSTLQKKNGINNLLKWFLLTVGILVLFISGARLLLLNPLVRVVLLVGLIVAWIRFKKFRRV